MLVRRLLQIIDARYEYAKFPQPLAGTVARGQVVQLAAVIELGVDRCY
ncbi:hypothetical protein [Nocardia abscessus]|nr:hypothetical protein [Nocardia abscessus]MCC3328104.1 hypothetical protein [Nocardia abscessus]